MPGNPVDSPWRSTPNEKRTRKPINLTLSDEGRTALEELATASGRSKAEVVEDLILRAHRKKSSAR